MITSTNIVPLIVGMLFMIGTMYISRQSGHHDLHGVVAVACALIALIITVVVCVVGYVLIQLL